MFKRALVPVVAAGLLSLPAATASAAEAAAPAGRPPTFNDTVHVAIHRDGVAYVGGAFTQVTDARGTTFSRRGAAAFDLRTGSVLRWRPQVRGVVSELEWSREGVYVGGRFDAVRQKARRNLALVSARTGKATAWAPRVNGEVSAIEVRGRRVYVGGAFTKVNRKGRQALAAFKRRGKLVGWSPDARGRVYDMEARRRGVYVAGEFNALNGRSRYQKLALVDRGSGGLVRSFNPSIEKVVLDLHVAKRRALAAIGGSFGGSVASYRTSDGKTSWRRRLDGDANSVTYLAGQVYVGGHFTFVCAPGVTQDRTGNCRGGSTPRGRGASFDLGSGALTGWDARLGGGLGLLTLDAVRSSRWIIAGGDFGGNLRVIQR